MQTTVFTVGLLLALVANLAAADGKPALRGPSSEAAANTAASLSGNPAIAPPDNAAIRITAYSVFPSYTIRRTVPEVRLQFSVADRNGRLVTGLTQNDLRILDNQSAVQRIRQFSRMQDLPLQLGILLDVSDSVQKTVLRERLGAQFFIQQVLRPQTDRAFLMAFAHDVKVWQSSTGDRTELTQALGHIQQEGYTTNLYDGLFTACFDQFPWLDPHDTAQRAIVLFSDGDDTDSLHGLYDVIALAQRSEIQIFAVAIHPRRKLAAGDEVLRRLADETGGGFYLAASEKDFPAIFTAMELQMRTQYYVSFSPQQETPGFHALRLELPGNQKFLVRVRQGYYFEAP